MQIKIWILVVGGIALIAIGYHFSKMKSASSSASTTGVQPAGTPTSTSGIDISASTTK